jgi:aminoglycoside 3-N-acetyltransferase
VFLQKKAKILMKNVINQNEPAGDFLNEETIIRKTPEPRTRISLFRDLKALKIDEGDTLIVHVSLSRIGWINGGPVALIQALMDAVTPLGTLVMPAQSGDLSEPSFWQHPPVPEPWIEEIRSTMPAYDPAITPTRGIGKVAEVFRTFPGVLRSAHPQLSFCAWGRHAKALTEDHALDFALGPTSPLGKLHHRNASVLLIGVDHSANTMLHLAEYLSGVRSVIEQGAPVMFQGQRKWVTMKEISLDSDRFTELGKAYEANHFFKQGQVGSATAKKFESRPLIEFAIEWLKSDTAREDAAADNKKDLLQSGT